MGSKGKNIILGELPDSHVNLPDWWMGLIFTVGGTPEMKSHAHDGNKTVYKPTVL